jgi:hypothetical protein
MIGSNRIISKSGAAYRVAAMVLQGVLGVLLLAPALSVNTASDLPACCRVSGKHKCALTRMAGTRAETTGGKSLRSNCPYSSVISFGTVPHVTKYVPQVARHLLGLVLDLPARQAQTEARQRISFSRTRQKRGPPISIPS